MNNWLPELELKTNIDHFVTQKGFLDKKTILSILVRKNESLDSTSYDVAIISEKGFAEAYFHMRGGKNMLVVLDPPVRLQFPISSFWYELRTYSLKKGLLEDSRPDDDESWFDSFDAFQRKEITLSQIAEKMNLSQSECAHRLREIDDTIREVRADAARFGV